MKWLLAFVLLGAALLGGLYLFWVAPAVAALSVAVERSEDVSFEVPAGATQRSVIEQLGKLGLVKDTRVLYYYVRYKKLGAPKTGEYTIGKELSPLDILDKLRRGEITLDTLSFPEGLSYKEIAVDLAKDTRMVKATELIALCEDADFLREQKVPGKTCEGYLFPDTYKVGRGHSTRDIVTLLIQRFFEVYGKSIKPLEATTPLRPAEIVTLASIVEKETGAAAERPHIASVFLNRLQKKIPLATDPTVIYAVTLARGSFDGNIRKADLQLDHPYNTYKHAGLPPGPISNPGLKSLEAVVKPLESDDIFFVSRNDGTSEFCPTLACHEAAVKKWQIDYFRKKRAKQ